MSSNTIAQDPMLAKLLFNPDEKTDKLGRSNLGAPDLVRAGLGGAPNAPSNNSLKNDAFLPSAQMMQLESMYQYSESMSLQLTTQEGDKVSIDFRQLYTEYQSYRQEQSTQTDATAPSGVRHFESKEMMESTAFEERFAFSVEGDLNENELKAIFDVFEQVDQLANNFFGGDIEKALTQAMALEIDFGQLKSFQLNLTQTETKAVSYQQAAVAEYDSVQENPEGLGVNMSDLPPYLVQWQMAIEKLDVQFSGSQKVFNDLMGDAVSQRFPDQDSRMGWFERVQVFHERLAEYATQQKAETEAVEQDVSEPNVEENTLG